ncbi:MAG TPA: hypothetical protein VHJ37_05990 [Thermoleophilaceae bacterium]|jgi:hypothetical protein|nr:hypothetical protein [Thermoleophilaceae bacterium]
MPGPLAEIAEGYTTLASFLLDRWSTHASSVASRLDAGPYDAESAVVDFATTASLATESGFLLASEALDALAICAGRQKKPHVVESRRFSTTLPGATLAPAGPLINGHGSDMLPASAVHVNPPKLAPGEAEFTLRVDATGRRAGAYVGTVDASESGKVESVPVWILVP